MDASQEMIALGLCNFAASFFQAYPTTGSFSRTAVNNASGVKTTAGGVFTGKTFNMLIENIFLKVVEDRK